MLAKIKEKVLEHRGYSLKAAPETNGETAE